MKIPRKIKKKIPKGSYCYSYETGKYKCCPFWTIDFNKPHQENGYCKLMKKGDLDLHKETIVTDVKTGELIDNKNIPFSLGLLWDQVKECGINSFKNS